MSKRVLFKHFCGSDQLWTQLLESGSWNNSIVFAKIWNTETHKWDHKIYAGKVDKDGHVIDYMFDIKNVDLVEIEQRVTTLENVVNMVEIDLEALTNVVLGILDSYVKSVLGSNNEYITISTVDASGGDSSTMGDIKIKADISIGDVSLGENALAVAADVKSYVDSNIQDTIEFINASIISLREYVDTSIANLSTYMDNKFDEVDSSITIIKAELEDVSLHSVRSLETSTKFVHVNPSIGEVHVELDVVDASDPSFINISTNGIATVGYVEERVDVFNWVVQEDNI